MSEEKMAGDEAAPTPTAGVGDPVEFAGEGEGVLGTPWSRRTFLKAAALGTAAAAVFQKGPGFTLSPAAAFANDLSGLPCTAQDVVIAGNGVVQNEPCAGCGTATFDAIVAFPVQNNTGTGRYCIALHIPGGFGVDAQDVILRTGSNGTSGSSTAPANQTTTMYGVIKGFPCNGELVCLGSPGVTRGKCAANTCVTIAWTTSTGGADCGTADQSPPGGQCRHQQICVQGFGATLECVGSDCSTVGTCAATCGGSLKLLATVAGGTSPYTYSLSGDDGTTQNFGPNAATTHCFTVTPTQASTVYTLTITDKNGCFRTATATVTTTPISVTLDVSGNTGCTDASAVVFTATPSGLANYVFKVDGVSKQSGTGNTYTYPAHADNACHTVSVTVTNSGGCTASASKHITQCITSTVADGACT